ncbi:hypothetical protein CpB0492 [Chlamydia pneumoniae TW-183]|uniref:Uncharacterized protein n=1 Tax=Chlamydia pneumoniae TaxID=83558 RepID=A0ABN3YPY5_CHLPN|nr:hypothetical protein CpB0492 [Chlamydia pneumoniae TW-183]
MNVRSSSFGSLSAFSNFIFSFTSSSLLNYIISILFVYFNLYFVFKIFFILTFV